ncbi:hypothetical protein K474DRAFT_1661824 [Panus rudis PR-1116 ss-1]|nr:hypothetical protein K474DRAFT_1661824 [Panus rudis PR-1116 ss-1]
MRVNTPAWLSESFLRRTSLTAVSMHVSSALPNLIRCDTYIRLPPWQPAICRDTDIEARSANSVKWCLLPGTAVEKFLAACLSVALSPGLRWSLDLNLQGMNVH